MYFIFHLTNGFVFIGKEGSQANTIEHCFNVRKYGTTKGIGQIAVYGGTEETIIDYHGCIEYNPAQFLFKTPLMIDGKKWFESQLHIMGLISQSINIQSIMPSKKKLKAVVSSLRNEVEVLSLKVSRLEAKLNEELPFLDIIKLPTETKKEPQFDPKQVEENLGIIIS